MAAEMTENTGAVEALFETLEAREGRIAELEAEVNADPDRDPAPLLEPCMAIIEALLRAYAAAEGKSLPENADLLAVQKAFVKGDPSLNAVRDNVRELIFYQNCVLTDRRDALPRRAARMAVRTTRHIDLYLRSRAEQQWGAPA